MTGLGTRKSNHDLWLGLKQSERVVYSCNGNRAHSARETLRKIEALLPRLGVTRVGEISQLSAQAYPVFQSARPHILYHSKIGQNTGAQGKGQTHDQAKISCLMETVEGYCLEPRHEILIRGSYDFLKVQHVMAHPAQFATQLGKKPDATQCYMWTEAISLECGEAVLVPAESVYFPFLPHDYKTEAAFATGSNGVAAGATYLEAVIHALYEVIERHYMALWEVGKIRPKSFLTESLCKVSGYENFLVTMGGEFSIELLALEIPGLQNLPMVMCWLLRRDGPWFYGAGCCAQIDTAIERALSEAIQGYAVMASGSREDMEEDEHVDQQVQHFPHYQTLAIPQYKKRIRHQNFKTLREELDFLLNWLHESGFKNVFVANLTRIGIDIPVVKVIVPGLKPIKKQFYGLPYHTSDIHDLRFRSVG